MRVSGIDMIAVWYEKKKKILFVCIYNYILGYSIMLLAPYLASHIIRMISK